MLKKFKIICVCCPAHNFHHFFLRRGQVVDQFVVNNLRLVMRRVRHLDADTYFKALNISLVLAVVVAVM